MMQRLLLLALCLLPINALAMGDPDPLIGMLRLDKVEINPDQHLHWKAKAYLGKDRHKLWLKTEGEWHKSELEAAEWRLLYGQAIAPYWDLMLGLRHTQKPRQVADQKPNAMP